MATGYAVRSGYCPQGKDSSHNASSASSTVISTSTDLYTYYRYTGVLEFTDSINTILGTSATSWDQLNITAATIYLRNETAMQSQYYVGFDDTDIYVQGELFTDRIAKIEGTQLLTLSETERGSPRNFTITSCFNSLTSSHSFKPTSSPWYMYFYRTTQNGSANERFSGISSFASYLDITGTMKTGIHYYTGSEWKLCRPYYYNGSSWVECTAQRYDGSKWVNC